MVYLLFVVLSCVCLKAESTDIAAVYKHGVLIVRNAESQASVLKAEDLYLKVPQEFTFPVALAHDPRKGTLFLADFNNEEIDVFAIHSTDEAVSVNSLVSKFGSSAIESMVYDPLDQKLIWTDSVKSGIYSSIVPEAADEESSPSVVFNEDVYKPRGVTIDYCKRDVYWTERHHERTIEKFNVDGKTVTQVARAKENIYYQAIDFNSFTNELIWAETEGDDESSSSCSIMILEASSDQPRRLASFERCYPFSITSDEEFIYWSDWSRNGIMRLPKSDPSDLKKLVEAPNVKTEFGLHDGAFGIVNMNKNSGRNSDLCPQLFDKTKEVVPVRTSPIVRTSSKFRNTISALLVTDNYDLIQKEKKPSIVNDAAASSAATFHDFSLRRLKTIVGILSVVAVFFMTTTIVLLIRTFCGNQYSQNMFKGIIFLFSPNQPSESLPTPTKRSKPYKRFGSSKTKAMEGALCPREASDGIQIEIEDCCQMTLCDTPCDYKMIKTKKEFKAEDKKCLLDTESA